jgi:hypothetical protein
VYSDDEELSALQAVATSAAAAATDEDERNDAVVASMRIALPLERARRIIQFNTTMFRMVTVREESRGVEGRIEKAGTLFFSVGYKTHDSYYYLVSAIHIFIRSLYTRAWI